MKLKDLNNNTFDRVDGGFYSEENGSQDGEGWHTEFHSSCFVSLPRAKHLVSTGVLKLEPDDSEVLTWKDIELKKL